jgi:hypothetical protein
MSENESGFYKLKDDVQQAFLFVDEIVKLVDSPNPSRAKTDIKHLIEFRDRAKQCLIDLVGKRLTDDEAIAEIKRLQTNQNRFDAASANYDPFQDKYKLENIDHAISFRDIVATYLGCSYDRNEAIAKIEQLTGGRDREIERLNRCISGIASFLDLPSDARQPDICFAIMELRQKYKKISREPSSYEQIVIVDWIARLVGK